MHDKDQTVILWPFFAVEVLGLIFWFPIAALAGMGYTPKFSLGNALLILFHLYPAYILIAIPVAYALRSYGKPTMATMVAILPPILSAAGLGLLFLLAKYLVS